MLLKLRGILFKIASKKYINLAKFVFKSEGNLPSTTNYPEMIKASGVLGNSKFNTFKLVSDWHEAGRLWEAGHYSRSVNLRSTVLQEMYAKQDISDPAYFPPFLSKEFGTAFGHLGLMAAHLEGTKSGILPPGPRYVPIAKEFGDREVAKSVLREYQRVPTENCGELLDLPSAWHISERLQMVKGIHGFIDLYVLLEEVYSRRNVNRANPILTLDSDYEERASLSLKKLGVPIGSWFVTLHIRNAGKPGLRRNQPIRSYIPSIEFITSQGGRVIRIGDSTMESFPEINGLIDLSRSPKNYWLHSFVLANGKFHLGTPSGPDRIPSLFGVPTLITNTTAISRNIHSLCEKSRYLPKHVVSNSQKWPLRKIFESLEGYAENEIDSKSSEYRLEPNTEIEILHATQEIYRAVSGEGYNEDESHMEEIDRLRKELSVVGFGTISQSFVEINSSSFLR